MIQARDGTLPMVASYEEEPEDLSLDEDLRLLYVAVTRAKDHLSLVWPRDVPRGPREPRDRG